MLVDKLGLVLQDEVNVEAATQLFRAWLVECRGASPVNKQTELGELHVVGALLCVAMHKQAGDKYRDYDLVQVLQNAPSAISLHANNIHDMRWQNLQDLVTSIQISYRLLVQFDTDGYSMNIDIHELMSMIMTRVGAWLGMEWKHDDSDSLATMEDMNGVTDQTAEGWRSIRCSAVVHMMDAIHSILLLSMLLMNSQMLSNSESDSSAVELHAHHREASIDTFYDLSMTADCHVGSIGQYYHRYEYLFHSISQVVYYHWPSYHRSKQIALEDLKRDCAPHVNVLPLIMQIAPDIPVLVEHTGAGHSATHSKHAFCWCVWAGYVILVDHNMQAFCASDLRTLVAFASANRPGAE